MSSQIRFNHLTRAALATLITGAEGFIAKNKDASFALERNKAEGNKLDLVARNAKREFVDSMPTSFVQKTSDTMELDVRLGVAARVKEYLSSMVSWKNLMGGKEGAFFFFSLDRNLGHVAFGAQNGNKILGAGKPTTMTAKFYKTPPPAKATEGSTPEQSTDDRLQEISDGVHAGAAARKADVQGEQLRS